MDLRIRVIEDAVAGVCQKLEYPIRLCERDVIKQCASFALMRCNQQTIDPLYPVGVMSYGQGVKDEPALQALVLSPKAPEMPLKPRVYERCCATVLVRSATPEEVDAAKLDPNRPFVLVQRLETIKPEPIPESEKFCLIMLRTGDLDDTRLVPMLI